MSDICRGADASVKDEFATEIKDAARALINEMLDKITLKAGDIFVVGCSSSEILGSNIGKGSSYEAAKIVFDEIYPVLKEKGIFLAAQCCEHLNRALVIERECAEKYSYEPVSVMPQPKAGGSFATLTYENMTAPVVVEHIKAHAGIDIGGTLIGMHLRDVVVPIRLLISKIGEANVICAYTRPKYIGGPRAMYN
ncbi:MAG: TIGR01440 family protein [Ruminococcaceae bacterium]|nr:TIGR01440 family protein [Oscillospiraceae bacterium]